MFDLIAKALLVIALLLVDAVLFTMIIFGVSELIQYKRDKWR